MKTLILMRHSIVKRVDQPTEKLPLSEEGKRLAKKVKMKLEHVPISKCFSSPYLRAVETAKILFPNVEIRQNLHERVIGDVNVRGPEFWVLQYRDHGYKNLGGECLNEVKFRMKQELDRILNNVSEGETVLVVSHATAICAYLMNYCKVEVIDPNKKLRKIIFNGYEVLHGEINPTDYFVIQYNNDKIKEIRFENNVC